MSTTTHRYPVTVAWSGGRSGTGTVSPQRSGLTVPIAAPPEFGGGPDGGNTSPEELLAAAVAACYNITFGVVAEHRHLPVESVETTAVGEVDQLGSRFTYARLSVKPLIRVRDGATDEEVAKVLELAKKADLYCLVTNAVRDKVQVTVEPEVARRGVNA